MMKRFKDLSEKEILAVAISNEEEDGRIYGEFADALRDSYPATAQIFEEMRVEEASHRDRLLALFRQRFGDHRVYCGASLCLKPVGNGEEEADWFTI